MAQISSLDLKILHAMLEGLANVFHTRLYFFLLARISSTQFFYGWYAERESSKRGEIERVGWTVWTSSFAIPCQKLSTRILLMGGAWRERQISGFLIGSAYESDGRL